MKRRQLLQAMLSVPIVSALGGCRHEHPDKHFPPLPARGGTLRVILQGPFALVVDTTKNNKITAYVPFTDDQKHEFRFLDPSKPFSNEDSGKRNRYKFTLPETNLEISDRPPSIDSGFEDVTLNVNGWKAQPEDYFVSIELPAPDYITYVPQAIPVVMRDTTEPRLAMTPTNHVLEYRIHEFEDRHKIVLNLDASSSSRSPQLKGSKPVQCQELHSGFQEHWKKYGDHDLQRPHIERALNRYSETPSVMFFLGVGVAPGVDDDAKKAHAKDFFNNKLLGGFPNAPEHDGMILEDVDVKPPCSSGAINHGAMLTPAVYRYPVPRLRPASAFYFTAADDCRAGVVNAINR